MKSIGFLILFLFQILNCFSQCNSTNRPFINSLSFDAPSDGQINVINATGETYTLQQKVASGTFTDLNLKINNLGLYNFKSNGSNGSCFRVVSKVLNCLPSEEICIPDWEVESIPLKNVVTVETIANDEIIILRNSIQAGYERGINSRFQFEDSNIQCRDDYVYRVVVKLGSTTITTHNKVVRVLAGDCAVQDILVPTVFTPNKDNINESLGVIGKTEDFYSLVIYNRWQNTVFETSSIGIQWNGNIQNGSEPATEGLYFYVLKKRNKIADIVEVKGTLLLVR